MAFPAAGRISELMDCELLLLQFSRVEISPQRGNFLIAVGVNMERKREDVFTECVNPDHE